jgi:hypothetical protein
MVMVCALRVTLPALLCLGLGGPAVAQQGGAYIDQITGSPTSRNQTSRAGSEEILARYGSAYGDGPYDRERRAGSAVLTPIPSAPAPNLGQTNNLAVLSQFGANNTGTIDQSGGTGNVAVATIVGSSNRTTQTQVGSDSNSVLNVLGNQNTLTAEQHHCAYPDRKRPLVRPEGARPGRQHFHRADPVDRAERGIQSFTGADVLGTGNAPLVQRRPGWARLHKPWPQCHIRLQNPTRGEAERP